MKITKLASIFSILEVTTRQYARRALGKSVLMLDAGQPQDAGSDSDRQYYYYYTF